MARMKRSERVYAIAAGNIPGESEDRIPDYDVFDDVDGSSQRVFRVCDFVGALTVPGTSLN